MKTLTTILLISLVTLCSGQVIPSAGYSLGAEESSPYFTVDIVTGEESAGLSSSVGKILDRGYIVLAGAYITCSKKTILELRGGFIDGNASFNTQFRVIPKRPLMIAMDMNLSKSPSFGFKVGFLIGDIIQNKRQF